MAKLMAPEGDRHCRKLTVFYLGKTLPVCQGLMEAFMICSPGIVNTPCLHLSVLYFWVNTALMLGCNVISPLLSLILFLVLVVKLVEGKFWGRLLLGGPKE